MSGRRLEVRAPIGELHRPDFVGTALNSREAVGHGLSLGHRGVFTERAHPLSDLRSKALKDRCVRGGGIFEDIVKERALDREVGAMVWLGGEHVQDLHTHEAQVHNITDRGSGVELSNVRSSGEMIRAEIGLLGSTIIEWKMYIFHKSSLAL